MLFSGIMVDKFGSYSPGFYMSGACVIISGLIPLLPWPNQSQEDNGSRSTVESCLDDNTAVMVEKLSVV